MTPEAEHQRELRLALEHAKEVLRPRRWSQLAEPQIRKLTKQIGPDTPDKEIFQAFQEVKRCN